MDHETADMIKRRLGEEFATAISANLEVKAQEVARKDAKGGKRKQPRAGGERKREQKEEKKEEKPAEEAPKQQEAPKTEAPKREGRRRGREGQ